jgi:hypothetical protein
MAAALRRDNPSMTTRRGFLIALSFSCIAAAAIWFASNFERRTQTEWVGFQGKARYDRWLAAQRLLERMGAKAQTVRSLPELGGLPRTATLLLPRGRQSLTPQSRQSLLNWVRQGGRLIVEAEPPYLPDPLLDQLGVRRKMVRTAGDRKGGGDDHDNAALVEIALPTQLAPVTVRMNGNVDVQADGALARFGVRQATTALLLRYGSGHALVLNELDALSNASIGMHDHAAFLWRIVQGDHGIPHVFFFTDPRKLSLVQWLRTNAWSAVAGSALLLLVWLWHAVPRFGPVAPDPERARRRLLDHLRASGRFLWAHGGAQLLVDAARESCLRRVARVHPDLIGVAGTEHEAERTARLAELLGLDAEQARMLFSQKAPARMIDFLHTIRLYQTVHERLALKRRATQHTREGQ